MPIMNALLLIWSFRTLNLGKFNSRSLPKAYDLSTFWTSHSFLVVNTASIPRRSLLRERERTMPLLLDKKSCADIMNLEVQFSSQPIVVWQRTEDQGDRTHGDR